MRYLKLGKGAHQAGGGEGCLMEMVSFLAGEKWSDSPICASPVIAAYGRALNDRLPDELRPHLTPYIPRLIGTRASREVEIRRGYVAADVAVRVFAPRALRARGLVVEAVRLESLEQIVDTATAERARAAAYAAFAAAYAAAHAAYAAADAAHAAAYADAWRELLPLALTALDEMIALGPGGEIPDEWFTKALCVIPEAAPTQGLEVMVNS